MNASTSPMHQALAATVAEASARLPSIKAPVDLLELIGRYGDECNREGRMTAKDAEFDDNRSDKLWPQIVNEVERLQGCEYDRDGVLDASPGVLLALSLQPLDGAALEAAQKFSKVVAEAQS